MELKEKKKMGKWNKILWISAIGLFIIVGVVLKDLQGAVLLFVFIILPIVLFLKNKESKSKLKSEEKGKKESYENLIKTKLDILKDNIGKDEEEIFNNLKEGTLFERGHDGLLDKYSFKIQMNKLFSENEKGEDEWIYTNKMKKAWDNYVAYQNEQLPSSLSKFNNYIVNDLRNDSTIKDEVIEFNESQLVFDSFINNNEIQTLDNELFTTLSDKLSEDNRRSIIRVDKHIEKYIDSLKNHIDVIQKKKVYNMEYALDKNLLETDLDYQTSIANGVSDDPSFPLENRITIFTKLAYDSTLTALKGYNSDFVKSTNKVLKLYFDVNALISLRNLMLIYFRENNLIFYDKVYLQFEELGFLFSEYENRSLTSLDNIQLSISNLTEKIEDGFARISSGLNKLAENQELQLQSMSKLLNKQDKALSLQNVQNSKIEELSGQVSFTNSNLVLNNFLQYRQLSATKNIMKELKK